MARFTRTLISLLIAFSMVLPMGVAVAPRPAHAFVPVGDVLNTAFQAAHFGKDTIADGIAWMIAKSAVSAMTRSLVTWINSGFQGSPAFATNLRQNLLRVGDAVAGRFFDELADGIVDSPYQDEIVTAVRTGYYLSTGGSFYVRNPFTLDQYSSDPDAFLRGDFSQGGLSAWFSTTMNQQNNPYGAYQLALGELDRRLSSAQGERITELDWGDGFMSYRGDCLVDSDSLTAAQKADGVDATDLAEGGSATSLAEVDNCLYREIKTPGSVISSQLNAALPKSMEGLVAADEIDEVIGALMQQLVTQVIGKTGLLGVSAPSSGGGSSILNRATAPNQQTGSTVDAAAQSRLATYETSWQTIGTAAQAAVQKCPDSSVALKAVQDSVIAQSRVSTATSVLRQPSVTAEVIASVVPTATEVAAAQASASTASGSLYSQLLQIRQARACPSN